MPRKSKSKVSCPMDDFDIRLANAWLNFRRGIADFVENVEECTVELLFVSSLDPHTHYSFDPDDSIFISDVCISSQKRVVFAVPYGTGNKYFNSKEAELIDTRTEGVKENLNKVIERIYSDAFAKVPEAPTILDLEKKYLSKHPQLCELLNSAEEALKLHSLKSERERLYSKLTNFGIF